MRDFAPVRRVLGELPRRRVAEPNPQPLPHLGRGTGFLGAGNGDAFEPSRWLGCGCSRRSLCGHIARSLKKDRSESVSRVLCPCGRRSFLLADDCSAAHATIPEALRAGRSASYLVLLRMGFGMRARSLVRRWALTPPFHPYPCGRCIFCATFRGSLRAAVSGHPALWSPDFPLPCQGKRAPDSLRRD